MLFLNTYGGGYWICKTGVLCHHKTWLGAWLHRLTGLRRDPV